MKKYRRFENFAVTLNGAIIFIAGVAMSFETRGAAMLEVIRRERLMRAGALPRGDYGIRELESI